MGHVTFLLQSDAMNLCVGLEKKSNSGADLSPTSLKRKERHRLQNSLLPASFIFFEAGCMPVRVCHGYIPSYYEGGRRCDCFACRGFTGPRADNNKQKNNCHSITQSLARYRSHGRHAERSDTDMRNAFDYFLFLFYYE